MKKDKRRSEEAEESPAASRTRSRDPALTLLDVGLAQEAVHHRRLECNGDRIRGGSSSTDTEKGEWRVSGGEMCEMCEAARKPRDGQSDLAVIDVSDDRDVPAALQRHIVVRPASSAGEVPERLRTAERSHGGQGGAPQLHRFPGPSAGAGESGAVDGHAGGCADPTRATAAYWGRCHGGRGPEVRVGVVESGSEGGGDREQARLRCQMPSEDVQGETPQLLRSETQGSHPVMG